jgi:hypothetical protein
VPPNMDSAKAGFGLVWFMRAEITRVVAKGQGGFGLSVRSWSVPVFHIHALVSAVGSMAFLKKRVVRGVGSMVF